MKKEKKNERMNFKGTHTKFTVEIFMKNVFEVFVVVDLQECFLPICNIILNFVGAVFYVFKTN